MLSKETEQLEQLDHTNFYIGFISDHIYDFIIVYANMKKIKISIDLPYLIIIKFVLFLYCFIMCIENSLLNIAGLFSVCGVFVSSLVIDLNNMENKEIYIPLCSVNDVVYESDCIICLEEFSDNKDSKLCKLSCQHAFHYDCMKSYIKVSKKDCCPTCRRTITSN